MNQESIQSDDLNLHRKIETLQNAERSRKEKRDEQRLQTKKELEKSFHSQKKENRRRKAESEKTEDRIKQLEKAIFDLDKELEQIEIEKSKLKPGIQESYKHSSDV